MVLIRFIYPRGSSVFLDHGLVASVVGFTAEAHTGVTVSRWCVESVGDGGDGE